MPPLSNTQLRDIRNVIEDFHGGMVAQFVDKGFLPKEKIDDLKKRGYIEKKASMTSFPIEAWLFSRMIRAVEMASAKKMPWQEFLLWLKKNPVDLSKAEKLAIAYAKSKAAKKIIGLGNVLNNNFQVTAYEADRAMAEKIKQSIRDGIALGIKDRENWQQIMVNMRQGIEDYARDWHQITMTELQDSLQMGLGLEMYGRDKGARVSKLPRPDCCAECARLYIDPKTGRPRIFNMKDILGNTNYKTPRASWKPTVETTHPLCVCQLVEIPEGFQFDEKWFLVPEAA
jgi:hypothetical protein